MGRDIFFITTPIYYPNDVPHIGHAYTSVAADVIARYHRLRGEEVFYLTGTDEHGLKLQRAAEAAGSDAPDRGSTRWRPSGRRSGSASRSPTTTTSARRSRGTNGRSTKFLRPCMTTAATTSTSGTYEGLYCVSCEAYYAEERARRRAPARSIGRPVEPVTRGELLLPSLGLPGPPAGALHGAPGGGGAGDPPQRGALLHPREACGTSPISRTSFDWGVRLPWDPQHVCYVWFDALTNYITAAGYATDPERFARVWPADIHLIGKDILRFHAVYWPAMLMAAGIELPTQVWAHGYLLVGGEKMSKTKLTGIHPFELLDHFGVDSYRYYFMREIQFGADGNFCWESMIERHNADLANGLGNLASRVLAMLASYYGGQVPAAGHRGRWQDPRARARGRRPDGCTHGGRRPLAGRRRDLGDRRRHRTSTSWRWSRGRWRRMPTGGTSSGPCCTRPRRRSGILAVLIAPVMPEAAARLWSQLGLDGGAARRTASARGRGVGRPRARDAHGEGVVPLPAARRVSTASVTV